MIKIVEPGKDKKEITVEIYKVTCQNCCCVFEFDPSDADTFSQQKELVMRDYEYATNTEVKRGVIRCPHCGCEINFSEYDLNRTETKLIDIKKYPKNRIPLNENITGSKDETISIKKLLEELEHPTITPLTITYNGEDVLDCNTCPSKPDPNKIIVGNTACTFCKKNQVTC